MNFDFDDDQKMLRDEAEKLLTATCPTDQVKKILNNPETSWDRDLWGTISELGWLGINTSEEMGGLGLGEVELCALAEQLGRAIAPLPVASSIYQFAEALRLAGSSEQQQNFLPGLADGTKIGCVAISDTNTNNTCVFENGALSGQVIPVIDGGISTHAIIPAYYNDKPTLVIVDLEVPNVTRTKLDTLDPSRDAARLQFNAVPADILGTPGEGKHLLRQIENRAAVYVAFEQIGGAQKAMEIARDYALERYCFGRPIGSYQAIKHKMADMFVKIELARSNAYLGAWALKGDNPALPRAAAAARVAACDAYWFAAKECVEIFGGIGTTLEADCHLHYRRSKQLALSLGGASTWRERLVQAIENESSSSFESDEKEVA